VPNISVTVFKTDGTLKEAIEKARELAHKPAMRLGAPERKVISEQKITINDLDAYECVTSFGPGVDEIIAHEFLGLPSLQQTPFLMFKEVCLVEKGRLYIIGCTARKSEYIGYLPVFERSIQTFHVREPAVEPLIQALRDENKDVRWRAAWTLKGIGDARAVGPLIQALNDEYKNVRMEAVAALGEIGDARAVEPLIQALKDEDSGVQWGAAEALGKIGDARAIEPLTQVLNDKSEFVRKEAKQALEKIKAKKS
jgi:hypothetical protein